MSYMYYSSLGCLITIVVGILVSWMTASEDDSCDDKLLNPYFVKLLNLIRKKPANSSKDHINLAFVHDIGDVAPAVNLESFKPIKS